MGVMDDNGVGIEHPWLGRLELLADADPDGGAPAVLFCENESNLTRLYGVEPITAVLDDRHPGDRQALSGLLVLCDRVALRNTLIASVQRAQVPFE